MNRKERRPDPKVLMNTRRHMEAMRAAVPPERLMPHYLAYLQAPSIRMTQPEVRMGTFTIEYSEAHWKNATYYGMLRRFASGFPIGGGPYAVLSLTARDESARHDWREFQQLKNLLVGEEWEAVELYPAESRLVDPSNRFYLFCVPKGVIAWGLPGETRHVCGSEPGMPPQRPFPATEG